MLDGQDLGRVGLLARFDDLLEVVGQLPARVVLGGVVGLGAVLVRVVWAPPSRISRQSASTSSTVIGSPSISAVVHTDITSSAGQRCFSANTSADASRNSTAARIPSSSK